MTNWTTLATEAPDLAARARAAFEAHKHKVLATTRTDGAPRVSGTELDFSGDDIWLGSMPGAMKARDLQRDPRFALHSAPLDLALATPDVKIAGHAVEITDDAEKQAWVDARTGPVPPGPFHLFRLDVNELVLTSVDGDHMVVESWHAGRGIRRIERT